MHEISGQRQEGKEHHTEDIRALLRNPRVPQWARQRLVGSPKLTPYGHHTLTDMGLNWQHFQAVQLQFFAGLSPDQIADALGYTPGRVRTLAAEFRRALQMQIPQLNHSRNEVHVAWLLQEIGLWAAPEAGFLSGPEALDQALNGTGDLVPDSEFSLDGIDLELFNPEDLEYLTGCLERNRQVSSPKDIKHLMLTGDTGTMKSTLVRVAAHLAGVKAYLLNCSEGVEDQDFYGAYSSVGGEISWVPGYLPLAAQNGAVFVLEEANFVRPAMLGTLHRVFDEGIVQLRNFGQPDLRCQPGFCVVATANLGSAYAGIKKFNIATENRFRFIRCSYPPVEKEQAHLARLGLNQVMALFIAEFAQQIRSGYEQEGLYRAPLSLRDTRWWAEEILEVAGSGKITPERIISAARHVWISKVLQEPNNPVEVQVMADLVRKALPRNLG